MDNGGSRAGRAKRLWRPVAVVVVVVALLVIYSLYGSEIRDLLAGARDRIEGTGPWAPLVFVLVYIVGVVACFPGTVLTVGAGGMFGAVKGILLVSLASTAGATCSFLIARYFARDAVAGWLEGRENFRKLDRLTREHGGVVVAITRLIPLFPYTLINYGFGLTGVRLGTYVLCSWLFMLPGTAAYVLIGAGAVEAAAEERVPWGIVIALAAVAAVLFMVGRYGRAYLKKRMAADGLIPRDESADEAEQQA